MIVQKISCVGEFNQVRRVTCFSHFTLRQLRSKVYKRMLLQPRARSKGTLGYNYVLQQLSF